MSRLASLSIRLPLAAAAGIFIVVVDYLYNLGLWPSNSESYVLGNCIAIAACVIAFYRGGIYSPLFWFTLAAAYVILSPLFSFSLGYNYYSLAAREYQTLPAMSIPTLEGSLATLILSLWMTSLPISARGINEDKLRLWFGPRTTALGLVSSCACLLFFCWLAEPGPIIGVVDLSQSRSNRFSNVRFAGGAWALFSVMAVYFYLGVRRMKGGGALILKMIFILSVTASLTWFFLHARRSETLGYMLYMYCILGSPKKKTAPSMEVKRLKLPEFINARTVTLGVIVVLFAAIGYYRTTLTWQFAKDDFVQSPGGVANNMLGYVTAFDIAHRTGFGIYPGETYLNQIQDTPPQFLGFPQAPDAYDILSRKVNLIGGEYWLMEPVMNFGGLGIAMYAFVIAWLGTVSVRAVRRSFFEDGTMHAYLQGGVFLATMFRTLWYGPSAEINGAIMALVSGLGLFVLAALGGALGMRKKKFPPRPAEAMPH